MPIPQTSTIFQPRAGQIRPAAIRAVGTPGNEPVLQKDVGRNPDTLALEEAHEKIVWVYRAVRAIYTNVGSVPFRVDRRKPDGTTEPIEGNSKQEGIARQIIDRLRRPNSRLAGNDLMEVLAMWMCVREAFLWMQFPESVGLRNGAASTPPLNLFVLPANRVKKVLSDGALVGWELKVGLKKIPLPLWQVIRIGFHNPKDQDRGLAPLMPSFNTADMDYAAELHNIGFFERGMRLSGIIAAKNGLTPEQQAVVETGISSLYSGLGNEHQVMVLPAAAEFTSLMAQRTDADFLNLSKLNKDKIGTAFGVPRFVFGDPVDANRASAKESRKSFWQDTLLPIVRDIAEKLSWLMVPHFGDPTLALVPDLSQIEALHEDRTEASEALERVTMAMSTALQDGVVDRVEYRQTLKDKAGLEIDPEKVPAQEEPDDGEPEPPDGDGKAKKQANARYLLRQLKNAALQRFERGARTAREILPSPDTERMLARMRGNKNGAGELAQALRGKIGEGMTAESLRRTFKQMERRVNG